MMLEKDDTFMRELIEFHVSGQLKVAPEHCSPNVLDCMGKPHIEVYERFSERFYRLTKEVGKEQYLVPYLISSHPGSTLQAVSYTHLHPPYHCHPQAGPGKKEDSAAAYPF